MQLMCAKALFKCGGSTKMLFLNQNMSGVINGSRCVFEFLSELLTELIISSKIVQIQPKQIVSMSINSSDMLKEEYFLKYRR